MNENNAIVTAEQSATDIVPSEKALAEALDTADKMVRMQYLAELDNMKSFLYLTRKRGLRRNRGKTLPYGLLDL